MRLGAAVGALVLAGCAAAPAEAPAVVAEEAPKSERAPLAVGPVVRSDQATFAAVTVATGISNAWGMAFLPDGALLITEKRGTIRVLRDGRLEEEPLEGGPRDVYFGGNQAGLHGIIPDPDFMRTGFVFVSWTAGSEGDARLKLARYRLAGSRLLDELAIYTSETRSGRIFVGGRMLFLADGTLLLGTGPQVGADETAQDMNSTLGKVLRFNRDGSIPADNPFVGAKGMRPEIWSMGHRNPEGLAIQPGTGLVWETEHGPKGGDELNVIRAGANYGWPLTTFGRDYDDTYITEARRRADVAPPAWYWNPSIAVSNIAFYEGDKFPEWRGDLFVTALARMHVQRLEMDGDRVIGAERLLADIGQRVRDVRTGPDGFLYVLTDDPEGKLVRLEPR